MQTVRKDAPIRRGLKLFMRQRLPHALSLVRKDAPIRRGLKLNVLQIKNTAAPAAGPKGRPDQKGIETSFGKSCIRVATHCPKGRPDQKGIETINV